MAAHNPGPEGGLIGSPAHDEVIRPVMIGIVGGHGAIGSLFARFFRDDGFSVLVSDRETPLGNIELAMRTDLVLVAVPLHAIPEVLAELATRVAPTTALVSLGSLMEPAAAALHGCTGEAFLLHPLFGPDRITLSRTSFALAPLRRGPREQWVRAWLRRHDAQIIDTAVAEHDRTMAVAQALLHGSYAALAPTYMAALPGADPLLWASPTLRTQLALMSRILHQDPRLYGDILALNRHTIAVFDEAIARLAVLRDAVHDGPAAVVAQFVAAREALGSAGPELAAEGDRVLQDDWPESFTSSP